MITTVKILFACILLTLSLSAMENDKLTYLLQEHLNIAQSDNNSDMLIFLNALKKAYTDKKYIEICNLNQNFLALATTLPQSLQKLAHEKFNTSSWYP